MWNHLHKLYNQTNKARKFYLDTVPAKYCQGSKTAQENFSGFLALSNEMYSMILKDVPSAFLIHVKKIKKESHVSQFQMDLRPEFEPSDSYLLFVGHPYAALYYLSTLMT